MKVTKRQLVKMIREQVATIDDDAIDDVVMTVLSDEGGAAGLSPIEGALDDLEDEDISLPDEAIEDIIKAVTGVKQHTDGDFVDTTQLEGKTIIKITKKQLRRIIKEAVAGSEPQELYNRMLELREKQGLHFDLIRKLGEDTYIQMIDLLSEMHAEDPEYDNYGNFHEIVRTKPYGIFPAAAHKLWFGISGRGGPLTPDSGEVMPNFEEHENLKSQFETVSGTSHVDSVYGRKRSNVVHTSTGTVVKSSTNRQGSLGT